MKRIRIGVGLIVVLGLVGSLVVATAVIGKSKTTVVHDPRGDGGSNGQGNPAFCDIVEATSKLTKGGKVRQTVTTAGKLTLALNAPPILIYKHNRTGHALPDLVLDPGETPGKGHARLTNHDKTVVYTVKRSAVKNAIGQRRKYFWRASQCFNPTDSAPSHGLASQSLKHTRHHHHHH